MTITIHTYQEDSKIQLAINYLKQIGLSFTIDNEEVDEETLKERESVRQQIYRKYVLLGRWNQFNDDEKQDRYPFHLKKYCKSLQIFQLLLTKLFLNPMS